MANKEQLISGLKQLSLAVPLMFVGPTFFFLLGRPDMKQGHYFWAFISVTVMAAAVFFMARGIKKLLRGFWDES